MTRTASALVLLVGIGCGERQVTDAPLSEPPPQVEIDGCQEVRGETCVLRSRPELTLWVGPLAPGAEVEFRADGRLVVPETQEAVQGGRRFKIVVPAGSTVLELSGAARERHTLAASNWPEWLFAAHQAFSDGDAEGVRGRLDGCRGSLDESSRAACWTLLAKTLSPSPERDQALEQALRSHRQAQHRFGEVDVATLIVKDRLDRGEVEVAQRWLAELPEAPTPARAAYLAAYWRGKTRQVRGEVGLALEQLAQAALLAERLDRLGDLRDVEQIRGVILQEIGRFEAAAEIFARLTDTALPAHPCERAELWNNVGWTRYLAREQDEALADPLPAFDAAVAAWQAGDCPPADGFNYQVNRAAAYLQAGQLAEVEAALAAAEAVGGAASPEAEWWRELVAGRLERARGDLASARERFARLANLDVPEARWRARFDAALVLGTGPEAEAELAAVVAELDERLARLPAQEGREWFSAHGEPVVRRWLQVLLARDDEAAAFDLVRRARSWVLRGFAAHRGGPSVARPIPEGELLLAFYPLDGARWVAFAATAGTKPRAVTLDAPPLSPRPTASLAEALLGPFLTEIDRARRLRLLPYGRLRGLDFHSLPFAGRALSAHRPVVYGLDLPAPARLRGTGRALVVGNPSGDLPDAEREAQEVAALLRAAGRDVELVVGRAADADTVRGHLAEGIELLHYAGHADFAGPGGLQSELRLARGTRLALDDLLVLNHAPEWVVLSACDSGKTTSVARVDGLGLAQTFVLGGSRAVVATTRPIADAVARPLILEFYRHWLGGEELAAALARAQNESLQLGLDVDDVAAFRVLEP
ncbi:MAG: CHAT domain-containing protein [Thermoanaerobaculia bacterium]|nr:CHAT domain-containing protein [Thermoanaerobaculia bacterium]